MVWSISCVIFVTYICIILVHGLCNENIRTYSKHVIHNMLNTPYGFNSEHSWEAWSIKLFE